MKRKAKLDFAMAVITLESLDKEEEQQHAEYLPVTCYNLFSFYFLSPSSPIPPEDSIVVYKRTIKV